MLAVEVEVRVVGALLWLCSLPDVSRSPPAGRRSRRAAQRARARGEGPVPGGRCFLECPSVHILSTTSSTTITRNEQVRTTWTRHTLCV